MMMMMRNIVRFETMSNLRYKTPKEIPVLLNNGSNCDYHFILRKTAEEFKRQFECFRENSEKCITFSVPLQKENENRCVKRVRIWRSSGPYFPAFGLNTERNDVSVRTQSECRKTWTKKTPNTNTFHAVNA